MTYINLLKNNLKIVGLFVLLVVVISVFVNATKPTDYEATFNFAIQKVNREVSEDWQYDDFYALGAVNIVGDTVQSWFISPAMVHQMTKGAEGVQVFHRKLAGQNIEVRVEASSKELAEKTIQGIQEFVLKETSNLISSPDDQSSFSAKIYPALVKPKGTGVYFVALAGALVGLGVGLMYLVLVKRK